MKLIESKNYKGFKTEFYILYETEKYLKEKGINIKDHLLDDFHWYEHFLFEDLNPELDKNWSEEKEPRRNFKVIYYGIIERWINKLPKGFEEKFIYDEKKVISQSFMAIYPKDKKQKPIMVKEIILIDTSQ